MRTETLRVWGGVGELSFFPILPVGGCNLWILRRCISCTPWVVMKALRVLTLLASFTPPERLWHCLTVWLAAQQAEASALNYEHTYQSLEQRYNVMAAELSQTKAEKGELTKQAGDANAKLATAKADLHQMEVKLVELRAEQERSQVIPRAAPVRGWACLRCCPRWCSVRKAPKARRQRQPALWPYAKQRSSRTTVYPACGPGAALPRIVSVPVPLRPSARRPHSGWLGRRVVACGGSP
jgi:hypothetical protein